MVTRRQHSQYAEGAAVLRLSGCVVDLFKQRVYRGGDSFPLSDQEVALLATLARQGGVVDRYTLLEEVWGYDSDRVVSRALDTTVCRLRRKIERDARRPESLLTVPRVGYQLLVPDGGSGQRTNLPADEGTLVGREPALEWLRATLDGEAPASDSAVNVAVLRGPPGVGKSRLARAFARARVEHLSGGAWLIPLADCQTARDITDAVSWTLGLPESQQDMGTALGAMGEALLILDGGEGVAKALTALLAAWSAAAPEARFVVTSQHQLGAWPERVLGPLGAEEARALLCQRAPRSVSPAALAALTERLGGLPLALELAASQLGVLEPESLLARLSPGGLNLPGERGTPIRRALRSAWELLTTPEREALLACAVFRGGCPAAALDAVTGAPGASTLADRLAEKSLLVRTTRDRYDLLESVRVFAERRLARLDPEGARAARHAGWFAERAGAWREQLRSPACADAADRLRQEQHNLRATRELLLEGGDLRGAHVVLHQCVLQSRAGATLDDLACIERAAALARGADDLRLSAHLIRHRSHFLQILGRLEEGRDEGARALALARASGDAAAISVALTHLSMMLDQQGLGDRSEAMVDEALSQARAAADLGAEVAALGTQAILQLNRAAFDDCQRTLSRARELAEETADIGSLGVVWYNLGLLAGRRGELDEAGRCYALARRLSLQAGSSDYVHLAAMGLSQVDLAAGRHGRAREVCLEALRYYRLAGAVRYQAFVLCRLGQIALDAGAPDAALAHLEAGRDGYRDIDPIRHGMALWYLACARAIRGERDAARADLAQVIAVARERDARALLLHALALQPAVASGRDPVAAGLLEADALASSLGVAAYRDMVATARGEAPLGLGDAASVELRFLQRALSAAGSVM